MPSKNDEKNDRVKTGINGLDKLLEGGIPRGNLVLLAGSCGTGKSTFGMQYVYKGCTEYDEPGVYVSFEEDSSRLISSLSDFGWDISGQIKKKRMLILTPELYKFEDLKRSISDAVDSIGAKRLVLDSFTLLSAYLESGFEARRALTQLSKELKKFECTPIAISDIKEGSDTFSVTGYEEFIADGVIVLRLTSSSPGGFESYVRSLFVRKMRGTKHSLDSVPIKFESDGITVYSQAKVF